MRKTFTLLILMSTLLSFYANSATVYVDGLKYYTDTSNNTASLTGYEGDAPTGELTIPSTITVNSVDYSVTSIGDYAFENCYGFTGNLTIPNSVTSIGDYAFNCCSGFTGKLTIPNSVTSIGDYAFFSCSGFTGSITIPNSVKYIGESTFWTEVINSKVDKFIIENSTPPILGWDAFPTNKFIYVPTGTLEAYLDATNWSRYTHLIEINSDIELNITLSSPNTLLSEILSVSSHPTKVNRLTISGELGDDDWAILKSNFTQLYYLDLSQSTNTEIPNEAFYGNTLLQTVILPNNLLSIGDRAFSSFDIYNNHICGLIGNLTIPSSVNSIGEYAFYGCSGLSGNLTFGNSVTSIGDYAFYGCSEFSGNLTFGNSVTSIGDYAFYGCSGLSGELTIGNSVTSIGNYAFSECIGFTESLTIGNSVTSIGDYAFYGCSKFTGNLTIGSSVTYIGEYAFLFCRGFTGNLTIGNSVTSIGSYAFRGCTGLTGDLTIPNSVISIGSNAFSGCSGFTGRLTIGSSVTYIGECAFEACRGFTGNLTLGNSVTSIGSYAFGGCSGFTNITTLATTPPSCETSSFSVDAKTCILEVPSGSVMDYYLAPVWGAFVNIVGVDVPDALMLVRFTVGDNGYITVGDNNYSENGEIEIAEGEDLTFTVVANDRYEIETVTLDNVDITDELVDGSYTISEIAANAAIKATFSKLPAVIKLSAWEQGAIYNYVVEGSSMSLRIEPTQGWSVNCVSYNGVDVTSELDENNYFTTPAIANNDALIVTYQQDGVSMSENVANSNIKVYASAAEEITIKGTTTDDVIEVYNLSGSLIERKATAGITTTIQVTENSVYIVKVAGMVYKLAL